MQGSRGICVALIAVAAAALAAPASAGPPPTPVSVDDDFFDPDNAKQILQSSTFWIWADTIGNEHNVREDHKLFYSGPLTDDPGTIFSETIPSGTFHYFCESHGSKSSGMDGIIKVKPLLGPPISDDEILVMWGNADFENARYDVQYRVNKGKWKNWRKSTEKVEGTFGQSDKPVDVKVGKTYYFRARTEKANNDKKASDYSPAVNRLVEAP
jgi:plastocyanin